MRFIIEENQFYEAHFCPYCGNSFTSLYLGDYLGYLQCFECDKEMEFLILEEYRDRYPKDFEKLISK